MSWKGFYGSKLGRWLLSKRPRSEEQLREFVYLDDVSVYSLLASQVGPIASEFTDTHSSSSKSSYESNLELDLKLLKLGDKGGNESTATKSSQVLRKSSIQSAFKELRETQMHSLLLTGIGPPTPNISSTTSLEVLARDQRNRHLLSRAEDISRGKLIEVEVELEPDPVFEYYATMSGMLDMMGDYASVLLKGHPTQEISQVKAFQGVLDNMLIGLVPLRARALYLNVVEVENQKYVVHKDLLDTMLSANIPLEVKPLYVVGVAKQELFWKDVRSFLFSRRTFVTYCRVANAGVSNEWSAVKLLDVFRKVAPGAQESFESVLHLKFPTATPSVPETADQNEALLLQLHDFASLVGQEYGFTVSSSDKSAIVSLTSGFDAHNAGPELRRRLFVNLTGALSGSHSVEIDRNRMAALREQVLVASEATPTPSHEGEAKQPDDYEEPEEFLECEFVSIYW